MSVRLAHGWSEAFQNNPELSYIRLCAIVAIAQPRSNHESAKTFLCEHTSYEL